MWNYIYRNKIDELGLPDSRASRRLVAIFCIGALIACLLTTSPFLVIYLYVRYHWYKLGYNIIGICFFANSVYYIWFIYWLFKYYRGRHNYIAYGDIFATLICLAHQIAFYFVIARGIMSKLELLT